MISFISAYDIILSILALGIIFIIVRNKQQAYEYKYGYFSILTKITFIRIGAGLFFTYIYLGYYGDGDTVYYYSGAGTIVNMAKKDLFAFFQLLAGERTPELRSLFDWSTGYPTYFKDANAWAVCRFTVPFYILGFGSYWASTIIMNAVMVIPMWRFYTVLVRMYPQQKKLMAIALFYMPSLVFWSSGILKDVWCYVALLQLYLSVYQIFIRKKFIWKSILLYIFWAYILISIRPFMFYTAFVTTLLWIGFRWVQTIESGVVKTMAFPVIMMIMGVTITIAISQLGGVAEGKYATVDSMLEHAVIIQKDLTRTEAYGENTFNIGEFDASVSSMLSKAPQAVLAGMFRPFLWEARSILMIFSGVESAFLMSLFLYLLFRTGFVGFFALLQKDPFLISCIAFAVMFGFFVGLTTANFGALVRYKIALIPFFTIVLFRIYGLIKTE
ncbi:MAG TPA: hypothetical protein PK199_03780 [Bacteroidales bacterium]|nr:hypothetical protein [Bacteroidales bacterium]